MVFLRNALLAALVIVVLAPAARGAEELVWATGRVMDSSGKQPLGGALVAVYDAKNRVVDYTKTDANGEYALAVPRSVLNLQKGGGGLLRKVGGVFGGVGKLATLPLKAGIRAAAGASTVADPLTKAGLGAATAVASGIVDAIGGGSKRKADDARKQPGVLVMKVSVPGHNDALSLARVYWMQEEVYRVGGKEQRAIAAWFDPARMALAGSKTASEVTSDYLTFTDARLEPSIAERGQRVRLVVTMPAPSEPRTPVQVVACVAQSNMLVPLLPTGDNRYAGEFVVDKRFPRNDVLISVLAYAEQDSRPGRSAAAEAAIVRAGLWKSDRPYVYNPLLAVSRNRAEVVLTVVTSGKR